MRFSFSSASDIQIYIYIYTYTYTDIHMIHQAQVLEVSSMRGFVFVIQ